MHQQGVFRHVRNINKTFPALMHASIRLNPNFGSKKPKAKSKSFKAFISSFLFEASNWNHVALPFHNSKKVMRKH